MNEDEEKQLTAKDIFFQTLDDTETLLIMSYEIDLIEEIPDDVKKRTLIICPENKIYRLQKLGFLFENIFQLPKEWHNYSEIHGKIFVQIKKDKIIVFFGSNNFTYAGMSRNFETYCIFSSQPKVPITIESLKQKNDISFWSRYTDEVTINSILDLFNHVFSNSTDNNYLSEEYFINTGLQSYFLHTAGRNTLLEGLKLALGQFKDVDRITIRVISPYTSAQSLDTFVSFFWKCLKRPFKLEILTNYLPDFQNNYKDSSAFIDPDQYQIKKQEYKKVNNIDIEMRFWSTEGIDEIPGNFIHSKLYFISSNAKNRHVFLLSSANFTSTAWGLEDLKNLEIGYIEFQQHNSGKVYDFFNEFWQISVRDEQHILNKIALVRKRLVNRELISEVPFKEFLSKPKVKGKHIKSSGVEKGYGFQKLLNIEVPHEEFIEEFLKGTIKINLKEYSPKIDELQAEIRLFDITNHSNVKLIYNNFIDSKKNEFSLDLKTLKKDIQLNKNIDSIIIRAKTDLSANDIQIKTGDWEKITSENIGSYSNNKIHLYNFSDYKRINTSRICAFLMSDEVRKIDSCEIDNSDIVIPVPTKLRIDQIKSIIIRQTQQESIFWTILFYQPKLLFEETPIREISINQDMINGIPITMLYIKTSKKWFKLDFSDFMFSYKGENVQPICVFQTDDAGNSILSYAFNAEFDELNVSLHPIFKRYFRVTNKKCSYLIRPDHKKRIDELMKSFIVNIDVKPKGPDETTPIKICLTNNSKETFGLEYKLSDGRLSTYKRPDVMTFHNDLMELNLGTLKPGQIIAYRPFIKIGNFRFYAQEYKEIIIKNRLIDSIEVKLPFNNHMRVLDYSKVFGHHFLFSLELEFKTKYNDVEKNILEATLMAENRKYDFIKVKSKLFHKDIFYVYFKINSLTELEGTKKIQIILNTEEHYSDFQKEIEIHYKKTKEGIFIRVDSDQKFIENGNKQIIFDEYTEVNFPLFEKNIKGKPPDMEFKKYEDELYLDSNELITPVWFKGYLRE